MKIYNNLETDFSHNGLGFLTDTLEAKVTENLNGDMYLEITYPVGGKNSEYLIEDNIIKCKTGGNNEQLFRIKRVIKSYTQISVYAPHIFYDLLDNFLLDASPTNLTAQSFGQWLLARTNFENKFVFYSDIVNSASARYVRRNPVEAIMGDIDNSMLNIFGGDIERDNFTIKLLSQRGNDNGVRLIFGKNIKQIKITTDVTSVYTRILPLGFDGLMIPETYVDSPLINNYRTPKVVKVEFKDIKYDPEDEEAFHTEAEAYQALRDSVNALYDSGIDKPVINIKIDWLELSRTEEYKNYQALETLHIGDSITAEILGINYSTRITNTKYNVLTDEIEKFEIGTISKTIANFINQTQKETQEISVPSILESAKNNATNQITNAMGGYVYKTNNELFIMDTDSPETAQKVWRWNVNGLGYSSTGVSGQYQTAITNDGKIVADMITTGTMSADRIAGIKEVILSQYGDYINVNPNTGELILGGNSDLTLHIDEDGISIYRGSEKLSWWIEDTFTATQINLGNFAFIPRSNGSLGFRKVK